MDEPHCYAHKWFEIECKLGRNSSDIPKPYLKSLNLEDENTFLAVGCNNLAFLQSNGTTVGGCVSICDNNSNNFMGIEISLNSCSKKFCNYCKKRGHIISDCPTRPPRSTQRSVQAFSASTSSAVGPSIINPSNGGALQPEIIQQMVLSALSTLGIQGNYDCNGRYCCKTSLPSHLSEFNATLRGLSELSSGGCGYALIASSSYLLRLDSPIMSNYETEEKLNELKNMEYAPQDDDYDSPYPDGEYYGNPYIAGGCKDTDTVPKYYFHKNNRWNKWVIVGIASSLGSIGFLIGLLFLYKVLKRRMIKKRKEKFFKRNGGLLLQKRISSGEVNIDRTTLFTLRDLKKATDNFNKDRILGKGGQGTVYKGMLVDGKIVAVKKFKVEGKVEEFINEFVILSQINNRNVVKLLGCCLETEIPLLVYEFIPNGNLFEYLHDQNEDIPMTWDMRLRIACEVGGALFYLHSVASQPIYHRDVKSTNILLDEKYRAKLADFGASRIISIEATHLTTMVQGTFGYLDPEYFYTSQFTEKSDVYSFGVVLAELLTGKKPISSTKISGESQNLASYFVQCIEENMLFDIMDKRVTKGGEKEHIIAVANLAYRCLEINGRKRPTMKEVTLELEGIRGFNKKLNAQPNDKEIEFSGIEQCQPWDGFSASNSLPIMSSQTHSEVMHILAIE
ncbi:wall-associated receptor kinase-like 1 [Vicia villosa]|uniref:wall-associated receptor kinase-like 1 n=1 Tax=Vicia villosa TaxID=3911 RepID=UPI00273A8BA5|nr:wall-associated receptor kinase-like 1 [Vicia villosa]